MISGNDFPAINFNRETMPAFAELPAVDEFAGFVERGKINSSILAERVSKSE